VKRTFLWLEKNLEPIFIVVLFFAMTLLISLQVVLRFGFNTGFSWAEELARFIFIWIMYFSFSYATRNQAHININLFINQFKSSVQKALLILADLLFLIFSIIIFISVIRVSLSTMEYNIKSASLDITMNVMYGAGVIGFLLINLRLIQNIWWKLKNVKQPIKSFRERTGLDRENIFTRSLAKEEKK